MDLSGVRPSIDRALARAGNGRCLARRYEMDNFATPLTPKSPGPLDPADQQDPTSFDGELGGPFQPGSIPFGSALLKAPVDFELRPVVQLAAASQFLHRRSPTEAFLITCPGFEDPICSPHGRPYSTGDTEVVRGVKFCASIIPRTFKQN